MALYEGVLKIDSKTVKIVDNVDSTLKEFYTRNVVAYGESSDAVKLRLEAYIRKLIILRGDNVPENCVYDLLNVALGQLRQDQKTYYAKLHEDTPDEYGVLYLICLKSNDFDVVL